MACCNHHLDSLQHPGFKKFYYEIFIIRYTVFFSNDRKWTINMVAINELLCLKNAGGQISLFFTSYEQLAPMAIKKPKILGTVLELPAEQQC